MSSLAERYAAQFKGQAAKISTNGRTSNFGGVVAPQLGGNRQPTTTTPVRTQQNVFQKANAVAEQAFDVAGIGAMSAGKFVVNTGKAIYQAGKMALKTAADIQNQPVFLRQNKEIEARLDKKQAEVVRAYKSGRMSSENYARSMRELSKAYQELGKRSSEIANDADPLERGLSVIETAANVLTLGRASTFTALVSAGAKKKLITSTTRTGLIGRAATKLEDVVTRVPAVRDLVERNAETIIKQQAQKLAGESFEQMLARNSKNIAVGLLIKRPIFFQSNVDMAQDIYQDILQDKESKAAWSAVFMASQMLSGGPIGFFLKTAKTTKAHLGALARGKDSYIDNISKRIGNGSPAQIRRFLDELQRRAPATFKEAEKTFRILQETNLRAANESVERAVDNTLNHYVQHGIDLSSLTPGQLFRDMQRWQQADELARKTFEAGLVKGVDPADAYKYVVVRWDSSAKFGLARAIESAGDDYQRIVQTVYEMAERPGIGWGNNRILMRKIEDAINQGGSAKDIANRIRRISTASTHVDGVPKKVSTELAKLGYTVAAPWGGRKTPIVDYDDTRKLVTAAIAGKSGGVYEATKAPDPLLSTVSAILSKAGLSPESSNEVTRQKLSEALVGTLSQTAAARSLGLVDNTDTTGKSFVAGGRAIIQKLEHYVETKKPGAIARFTGMAKVSSGRAAITDVRQLRVDEIQEALGVSYGEAREVSQALREAYAQVPLEFRGLGDKIVDYATRPNLSPLRAYTRIQSALRYVYNPFFRFQEMVETAILSRMNANKFLWLKSKAELEDTATLLEREGVFSGNVFGPGADDNVFGKITASLTKSQKRNLAGLAMTIAEGQGKTVQQVLRDNPEQIEDALRVIVQYPKKGAISSPLGRTINLAFFPMRYNIKVATLAAEKLAEMPPSLQFAFVQSLFKFKEWLKTDEGLRWQADYADAIQVFSWASPVGNITQLMKVLGGNVESPGDLGLLGGLPFGVISQVLDGQGIINLNKPYVDPKTGDVLPEWIPQTTKARAATALQDVLGTMFSYPGRTLGLPGKDASIRKAVQMFIETNGEDFDKRVNYDQLTPLQLNLIRVLKGDTSDEALDALYTSPAPGQFNYYTLPPVDPLPVRALSEEPMPAIERRQGLPTKAQLQADKKARQPRQKPKALPIPPRS